MYWQMDIFDFIEKPLECGEPSVCEQPPSRTQFEQLFEKAKDPVLLCTNCLCQYCANNIEEYRVKPEEMQEPCFICDECRIYNGDHKFRNQRKEECENFVMSDYGTGKNRKRIKLIKK